MNEHMTLAQRREALVARCELQRADARSALSGLTAPVSKPAGMLASVRERFGGNIAVPLALAGVAIGFIVMRPKKAIPMLTAAAGAWKVVSGLLATVRHARGASLDPDEAPI
jgi:hypothetical protein